MLGSMSPIWYVCMYAIAPAQLQQHTHMHVHTRAHTHAHTHTHTHTCSCVDHSSASTKVYIHTSVLFPLLSPIPAPFFPPPLLHLPSILCYFPNCISHSHPSIPSTLPPPTHLPFLVQLEWIAFAVMVVPTIGIPFFVWYQSHSKYEALKMKKA